MKRIASAHHAQMERELAIPSPILDVIAEIIEAEPAAKNSNLPSRWHASKVLDAPGLLQRSKVVEFALIDGFCDAALNRPMSISVRFCEANLHVDNMLHWDAYSAAYQEGYRRRAGAA